MSADTGTILVVDDDRFNRLVLSASLQGEGYSVETAEDGRQALEALAARPFDAVLLDLLMPEMDGYQVLEQIKAHPTWRNTPVIIVSALDEMESIVRCIELGATDYLPKPFDAALLRARLNTSLATKRLRDMELEVIEQVGYLTRAAAAVEQGLSAGESLDSVAQRGDSLGQLARVFQRMAREVYAREQSLKQLVEKLRIEIDETKKEREVAEITETDYFRELLEKAEQLRAEG